MLKSLDYLKNKNIEFNPITINEAVRTAQDVQKSCNCELSQVLKTLVFIGGTTPVIVIVPGDKRVDVNKLKGMVQEQNIRMANPIEVQEITSCKIGEVSPFSIESGINKILDENVFNLKSVFVGSGQGDLLLHLSSQALCKAWDGNIADISQ